MKKTLLCLSFILLMISLLFVKIINENNNSYCDNAFSENGIIMHRGLSYKGSEVSFYPENTLPAFEAAAKLDNIVGIETDIQETKDNEYVCFHDIDIQYRTDATGYIQDYTLDELNNIHIDYGANIARYKNISIPTLEDFLKICKKYNKKAVLDIKNVRDYSELFKIIKKYLNRNQYIIGCGSEEGSFQCSRIMESKCNVSINIASSDQIDEILKKYSKDKNVLLDFEKKVSLTKEDIKKIHKAGMKVAVWIINDKKLFDYYKNKLNVDYIYTERLFD